MVRNTFILIILAAAAIACSEKRNAQSAATQSSTQPANNMKNLISIVEIPTDSFSRATKFYETVFDLKIQQFDMQGTTMGLFPGEEGAVNIALVHGSEYKPSRYGALTYFNGGDNLQKVLEKVENAGGKIVVPKTEIDAENGFFATFIDSEGNKIGLHSPN